MIASTLLLNSGRDVPRQVADLVADLAGRGGLDQRQAYRLRLAADEITTNIATHGYRGREGVVRLCAGVDEETVWLRIEDDAPPFDPTTHHPDPRLFADPPMREVGGLGLHLALTSVDRLAYDRVGDHNLNTLIMRRPGSRTAEVATDGGSDGHHISAARL